MRNLIDRIYDTIKAKKKIKPKQEPNINSGDADVIGKEFLNYFIKLGELKSTDQVLDVGSGYGRMAVALSSFLSSEGSYEGIEIIPKGVDWCTKNITPNFKNFHFQLIDVKNDRYNPAGKQKASQFKFPFEDASFDFIFLTSVFTHMLPADLENYLSEISRVLKKGGKTFITYFLLNDKSKELISEGESLHKLPFDYENCRIEYQEDPEHIIAYEETDVINLYTKYGLDFSSTHYGNWCGREDFVSHQDIVIGTKY